MAKRKTRPAQTPAPAGKTIVLEVPEGCGAESVSIGNFSADLVPGSVIETESREFADYLTANFGCKEVQGGSGSGSDGSEESADENAGGGEE